MKLKNENFRYLSRNCRRRRWEMQWRWICLSRIHLARAPCSRTWISLCLKNGKSFDEFEISLSAALNFDVRGSNWQWQWIWMNEQKRFEDFRFYIFILVSFFLINFDFDLIGVFMLTLATLRARHRPLSVSNTERWVGPDFYWTRTIIGLYSVGPIAQPDRSHCLLIHTGIYTQF